MAKLFRLEWIFVVLLVAVAIQPAAALEGIQSPYLKGYRDFMAGVLGRPGVYLRHDIYAYNGTEHSTIPQGKLTVRFTALANILGATFVTPYGAFGGDYAFAVRGAFSDISANQSIVVSTPIPATRTRIGELDAFNDIVISPFIIGWHAGNLHWNFSTSVWLPVGSYDKNRLANTGRNVWAFSPQIGVTYFDPKSGWDLSGAAIYVNSATNTDTNYRSGDIVHVDFAAGKMLNSQFKLGVVGYYAQQLSADSGSGALSGSRKLRSVGLGPGASFSFAVNRVPVTIVAKYYREFIVQNTTQGDVGTLSARVHF